MSGRGLQRKLCTYRGTQGKTLIPPTQARAHLLALTAHGWNLTEIQNVTGLDRCALGLIRDGSRQTIRWSTEQRILAVNVHDHTPRSVPSIGSARRVQSLYALGHPLEVTSQHVGRTPPYLSDLVHGRRPSVSMETHTAVQQAYDRLGMTIGNSIRAKRLATKNRWACPLLWDDDAIDDPNGFPDWTGHCGNPNGWLLHAVNEETPCAACIPHQAGPDDLQGAPKLAERFPEALAVIAESEKTWAQAGAAIGVSDYLLRKAHAEARARQKSQPEVALAA
jgi:hypothetical protein